MAQNDNERREAFKRVSWMDAPYVYSIT